MSDRLHREIEDLLSKLDTLPPPRRRFWARARDSVWRTLRRFSDRIRLPSPSAGHVLLFAIALIVIAYVALPGGSDVTRWLIAAGIVLFIAAFIFSLRRQSRPPEKYWRDKPIDLRRQGHHDRSRSWWERWRNRR